MFFFKTVAELSKKTQKGNMILGGKEDPTSSVVEGNLTYLTYKTTQCASNNDGGIVVFEPNQVSTRP